MSGVRRGGGGAAARPAGSPCEGLASSLLVPPPGGAGVTLLNPVCEERLVLAHLREKDGEKKRTDFIVPPEVSPPGCGAVNGPLEAVSSNPNPPSTTQRAAGTDVPASAAGQAAVGALRPDVGPVSSLPRVRSHGRPQDPAGWESDRVPPPLLGTRGQREGQ